MLDDSLSDLKRSVIRNFGRSIRKMASSLRSNKPFTNQSSVINVLKPEEDPLGLASKRILTKEEMKLLEKLKSTAKRLGVLDQVS